MITHGLISFPYNPSHTDRKCRQASLKAQGTFGSNLERGRMWQKVTQPSTPCFRAISNKKVNSPWAVLTLCLIDKVSQRASWKRQSWNWFLVSVHGCLAHCFGEGRTSWRGYQVQQNHLPHDIRIQKKGKGWFPLSSSRTQTHRQTQTDRHTYAPPSPIYTHSYIVHPLDLSPKGSAFSY